jgi:hypothetical protein
MLNWLRDVVATVTVAYGGAAPERAGQAIIASIPSRGLFVDLVPAGIFSRLTDDTTFYNIPRGDQANSWILTSPRTDIAQLNAIATARTNFKNVVRIAKYVKSSYNFLVSSFAIESAIVRYGQTSMWGNVLETDVRGVLMYLAGQFRVGFIPDPYDASNNLIAGVASLTWYASRLDTIVQELFDLENESDPTTVQERVAEAFSNAL